MDRNTINDKYINNIIKDKGKYYNDYLKLVQRVTNSSAIYMGEPIPFLYNPMFFTEREIEDFDTITSTLMDILTKVINNYIEAPKYREKFGFSKTLEQLILIDPGYDYNVPMGRFDVFYKDKYSFKFCELNADGSSAMNETNVLERIFLESKGIKELKDKYQISYKEMVYKWVDESLKIFKEWSKADRKPNVGIVDFEGGKTLEEFKEFKKAYIAEGYRAEIIDPRQLKYIDGKLVFEDMEIDLVYRRLVTSDMMRRIDEIPDFIEAYKNKAACFIGPIRSQIIHNKIIFKVLHDEETLELLTDEEKKFIKNHIPYTEILTKDSPIYKEAIENKEKYVLKPSDLYASLGVYVGLDLSQEEWESKMEEALDKEYLLQEFVKPYTQKLIKFVDNGEITIEDYNHIIGIYMYGEKLAGFYTRVNKQNIISSLYDCYTIPNLIVSD